MTTLFYGFINENISCGNKVKQSSTNINENTETNKTDAEIEESKIGEDILKNNLIDLSPTNAVININILKEGQYDIESVAQMVHRPCTTDGRKLAFLTFDDGPSTTVTPKILDILKENKVRATFFVVGKRIEAFKETEGLIKRMYNEGHSIGNHTYSHDLRSLYPRNRVDIKTYLEEIEKTDKVLKRILGEDFRTRVTRMPGGDLSRLYYRDRNLQVLKERMKSQDMYSVDWNALNEDAEGKGLKADGLFEKLKANVKGKDKAIILMHDGYGKEQTAKALDRSIKYLKSEGYEFGTIN